MKRFKNKKDLRNFIASYTTDLDFKYKDKWGAVCPLLDDLVRVIYDNKEHNCKSVDEAMTIKFFDGKSLNQIATELDF